MRFRLDSSLRDDRGWTTFPASAQRLLIGTAAASTLRDESGRTLGTWDHPLAALEWLDAERRKPGRWVGFLGYELGGWLEPAAGRIGGRSDDLPLFAWGWIDEEPLLTGAAPNASHSFADHAAASVGDDSPAAPAYTSNFTREQYLQAARRCIQYIRAGDVFQINLSQRLRIALHDPVEPGRTLRPGTTHVASSAADVLYETLLQRAPACYGALIELPEVAILSNSPELFLHVAADRHITTRPIKGTRPLLPGMDRQLRASPKDAAELNMIVDLERNDLGRICEIGSVHVTEPRAIEAHPTVYHGVATIEGQVRGDIGLVELLRATFPGGSVTGAPKIRAMQIIDELEPGPRGVYCGAIGHLDSDGSMQLNLAIRTLTFDKRTGRLEIPVGGGIVADSDPAAEYEETLVKARAALEAVAACSFSSARSAR